MEVLYQSRMYYAHQIRPAACCASVLRYPLGFRSLLTQVPLHENLPGSSPLQQQHAVSDFYQRQARDHCQRQVVYLISVNLEQEWLRVHMAISACQRRRTTQQTGTLIVAFSTCFFLHPTVQVSKLEEQVRSVADPDESRIMRQHCALISWETHESYHHLLIPLISPFFVECNAELTLHYPKEETANASQNEEQILVGQCFLPRWP